MKILGTDYELIQDGSLTKSGVDGLCFEYTKQIKIRPFQDMLGDEDTREDKRKRYNEVLRHEAIHAFLVNLVLIIIRGMKHWSIGLHSNFPKCSIYSKNMIA